MRRLVLAGADGSLVVELTAQTLQQIRALILPGREEEGAPRQRLATVEYDPLQHAVAVPFQPRDPFLAHGDAVACQPLETLRLDLRRAVAAQHEIAAPGRELQRHADPARAAAV